MSCQPQRNWQGKQSDVLLLKLLTSSKPQNHTSSSPLYRQQENNRGKKEEIIIAAATDLFVTWTFYQNEVFYTDQFRTLGYLLNLMESFNSIIMVYPYKDALISELIFFKAGIDSCQNLVKNYCLSGEI